MEKEFISKEKAQYITQKTRELIDEKVTKEEGKGLSANDFTDDLKTRLEGVEEGANKTTVDEALNEESENPIQNKVVTEALGDKADLASPEFTGTPKVPTASEDSNDTQAANTAFVKSAIAAAVGDIVSFDQQVVTELPETGEKGTIYLIANNSDEEQNVYDEYIWTGSGYEHIGSTKVDLTGYVKEEDLGEVSTEEIDSWFATA